MAPGDGVLREAEVRVELSDKKRAARQPHKDVQSGQMELQRQRLRGRKKRSTLVACKED